MVVHTIAQVIIFNASQYVYDYVPP